MRERMREAGDVAEDVDINIIERGERSFVSNRLKLSVRF
ncbi:protein of unknown function [Candidatus Filomicrobium marinum]|uniref:Uncharacterized protein n=1 Tax=Candidatus Filomicrobium marinum TaxID=1608628 RepID=A0A0D6JED5_9HYPH|nr:protein of unknown function [Candidatus Filomicrobium marinum]CPR17766.1 protein of unknown function [Candidatus Filomicrobium marinum]